VSIATENAGKFAYGNVFADRSEHLEADVGDVVAEGHLSLGESGHEVGGGHDADSFTGGIADDEAGGSGGLHFLDGFSTGRFESKGGHVVEVKIGNLFVLAPVLVGDESRLVEGVDLVLREEAVLVHPVGVQKLGHVVSNTVGADDDAGLVFSDVVLLDVLEGVVHGGS